MTGILEEYLWSSTYWQYIEGMEEDPNFSSLERGYPVVIAGNLLSYHYDYEKKGLTAKWEAKNGKTIFYMPDLSTVTPQDINLSSSAEINIEKFKDVNGGFVNIVSYEDTLLEIAIG